MADNHHRVSVSDAAKIRQIVSKRWICTRCGIFCMELVPVIKRGMRPRHLKVHKMLCRNGCHEKDDWRFHEFKSVARL